MSVSASPPPSSPGNRHRSRPSFAIAYPQPSPLRMSTSGTQLHDSPTGVDPKSSMSASSIHAKPPASPPSNVPTTTAPLNTNQAVNLPPSKFFVAPAHPQSHHLHTLPPREKTTRTLILDHTAWRQGRTRLAQGRCELGMTVKFKNEEHADHGFETVDRGSGFYIGSISSSVSGSGSRRVSNFGEPSEIELASSDDEGDGDVKESDGEGVRSLLYGKHYKRTGRRQKQETEGHDRMEVDTESDSNSGSDSEIEPSTVAASVARPQDLSLAPSLAARATGIEKVLRSMLAQPPSSPPRSPSPPPYALHSSHANSQHYRAPPSAQSSTPSPSEAPGRVLPNGLRLRLALLALVNDLFERQPPPCQLTSGSEDKPPGAGATDSKQTSGQSSIGSPPPLPPPSLPPSSSTLPSELAMLAQISSQPFNNATQALPSFQTLTMPSTSSGANAASTLSPISGTGYKISPTLTSFPSSSQSQNRTAPGSGKESMESGQPSGQQALRPPPPLFSWTRPSAMPTSPSSPLPLSPSSATPFGSSTHEKDSERVQSTAQSLPRLPSSWKRGAPTEQPDKSASIPASNPGHTTRARGRSRDLYAVGCNAKTSRGGSQAMTSSFRSNAPVFSLGGASAPTQASGYPLKKLKFLCPRHLREQCKICTSSVVARGGPSTRIGAGLLKKRGRILPGDRHRNGAIRQSGCVLADLIPRFLRLSALVAMELGREARGEEPEANEGKTENDHSDTRSSPSLSSSTLRISHAQPTRAWFGLLCGLLTRAVLEGYVARDWKGAEYAEILLGVGLGIKGVGTRRSVGGTASAMDIPSVDDYTDDLEPDEMPRLIDAAKVLFSGLVQDASVPPGSGDKATQSAEEEYVVEMEERMSEFLTVLHGTPDLATHLTQLSQKYPAEPVERAALRFCEAVAKWRGKPELAMYKKQQQQQQQQTAPPTKSESESSTPALLSIDALLTTTTPTTPAPMPLPPHRPPPPPPPPLPPIDRYFRVLPGALRGMVSHPARPLKRSRSVDASSERESKREKVDGAGDAVGLDGTDGRDDDEAVLPEDNEWVGPYGM